MGRHPLQLWNKSFTRLCLASRTSKRPVLAIVLRQDSEDIEMKAAQFLMNSATTAKEMLKTKFALVAFSMTSPPVEEFNAVFNISEAEICFVFGHVTHEGSF